MDSKAREFAAEHRRYLQENLPHVLEEMRRDGSLHSYLSSVGKSAEEMYEHLLAKSTNRPEIQNLPFHQRVSASQNLQQSAEEIVRDNIIFQPRADSEMDEALNNPIRDWDEDVLDAALKNWPEPKATPSQPPSDMANPPVCARYAGGGAPAAPMIPCALCHRHLP